METRRRIYEAFIRTGYRIMLTAFVFIIIKIISGGETAPIRENRAIEGKFTTVYNNPYQIFLMIEGHDAASLTKHSGNRRTLIRRVPIGLGTIISTRYAVCAASNIIYGYPTVFLSRKLIMNLTHTRIVRRYKLLVFSGRDIEDLPKTYYYEDDKTVKRGQRAWYFKVYEDLNMSYTDYSRSNYFAHSFLIDRSDFYFNIMGDPKAEIALIFFKRDNPIVYSPYVLPVPLGSMYPLELKGKLEYKYRVMDSKTGYLEPCHLAAFSNYHLKLITVQLTYVAASDCREIICIRFPWACFEYPDPILHLCFKSLSLGDVCSMDTGSVVFCPIYKYSGIAVLTKTFDCGLSNLPAIYTKMGLVYEMVMFTYGGRQFRRMYDREYETEWYKMNVTLVPPIELRNEPYTLENAELPPEIDAFYDGIKMLPEEQDEIK